MYLATGRPAIYQLFDAEARFETADVPFTFLQHIKIHYVSYEFNRYKKYKA
jgi:hypothetical protein